MTTYYSHGKLLISGEYAVLQGAWSLAVPLRFGQTLKATVEEQARQLLWQSFTPSGLWFEGTYSLPALNEQSVSDAGISQRLQKILRAAAKLNPNFLNSFPGLRVETFLNFQPEWGLGSSSSLISNIAWWFDIDPIELHFLVSTGSGYDVACARSKTAILYRLKDNKPEVVTHRFDPPFKHHLFFVYLGKKQLSDRSITSLASKIPGLRGIVDRISAISKQMAITQDEEEFGLLMREHEGLVSEALQLPTARDLFFHDTSAPVKSLGAWGGDFVMILWKESPEELADYLHTRGFFTFFSFDEIILSEAFHQISH